ncbi:DUF305 domain-containing protein [Streptomyces sp. NPDC089919]|uniref:DUF305 domain-containing protein n=1 Tax=Streptomyces sp. NPDC089919 TaxID=3155188 RepID=UPI0034166BC5
MNRTRWAAVTAVVLALLVAGATTFASARGGSSDTPSVTSADAGFARDMAVHHQQAVEMSFIVRDRTQDEAVRRLAYDIANTQANQRGMLLGWLDLWGLPKAYPAAEPMAWMAGGDGGGAGHDMEGMDGMADMPGMEHVKPGGALMPGMATAAQLDRLRKASGKAAEVLYLQLMTDHHKGGVAMAKGCARLCRTGVEKDLAAGMVAAQQSELELMADMLKERGAPAA